MAYIGHLGTLANGNPGLHVCTGSPTHVGCYQLAWAGKVDAKGASTLANQANAALNAAGISVTVAVVNGGFVSTLRWTGSP